MASSSNHTNNIERVNVRALAEQTLSTTSQYFRERRRQKILQNVVSKPSNCSPSIISDLQPSQNVQSARDALNSIGMNSDPEPKPIQMAKVNRATDGLTWVRVQSNLRLPDDVDFDFFVPYLGESEAHLKSSNELAEDLFESNSESGENESDIEKNSVIDANEVWDEEFVSFDEEESGGPRRRSSQTKKFRRRKRKVSYAAWDRINKRVALKKVVDDELGLSCPRTISKDIKKAFKLDSEDYVGSYYKNVKHRLNAWAQIDNEKNERIAQRGEVLKLIHGETKNDPSNALAGDSLTFHFCRQCYVFHCSIHAALAARPAQCPTDKTRRDYRSADGDENSKFLCSEHNRQSCWYFRRQHESQMNESQWWQEICNKGQLSEDLKSTIKELLKVFGHDYCRVSVAWKNMLRREQEQAQINCNRVGYVCKRFFSDIETTQCPPPRSRKRTRRYVAKAEDRRGGLREDYLPCMHDGACSSSNCTCIKAGIFCEKFCGCNNWRQHNDGKHKAHTCRAMFPGCNCKTAISCASRVCPCYCAGRECDPDVCGPCQECKEPGVERSCQNLGLLLRKRQRVVVGRSPIHGWGAFAVDNIPKRSIIGEYVGEIIPQHQAERRGRVYDEANYSFLFNTTNELAIDSTRLGNKLRYCNHSTNPNCEPRLLRVRGDVRVGIFAKRDIAKNEELTFNYQYNGRGPAWANSKGSSKNVPQIKLKTNSDEDIDSDMEMPEILPSTKSRRLEKGKAPTTKKAVKIINDIREIKEEDSSDSVQPIDNPEEPHQIEDSDAQKIRRNNLRSQVQDSLKEMFGSDLESDSQQTATASPIDEPNAVPMQSPELSIESEEDDDWEPSKEVANGNYNSPEEVSAGSRTDESSDGIWEDTPGIHDNEIKHTNALNHRDSRFIAGKKNTDMIQSRAGDQSWDRDNGVEVFEPNEHIDSIPSSSNRIKAKEEGRDDSIQINTAANHRDNYRTPTGPPMNPVLTASRSLLKDSGRELVRKSNAFKETSPYGFKQKEICPDRYSNGITFGDEEDNEKGSIANTRTAKRIHTDNECNHSTYSNGHDSLSPRKRKSCARARQSPGERVRSPSAEKNVSGLSFQITTKAQASREMRLEKYTHPNVDHKSKLRRSKRALEIDYDIDENVSKSKKAPKMTETVRHSGRHEPSPQSDGNGQRRASGAKLSFRMSQDDECPGVIHDTASRKTEQTGKSDVRTKQKSPHEDHEAQEISGNRASLVRNRTRSSIEPGKNSSLVNGNVSDELNGERTYNDQIKKSESDNDQNIQESRKRSTRSSTRGHKGGQNESQPCNRNPERPNDLATRLAQLPVVSPAPVVNLISDDEDEEKSSRGSYQPDFYTWMS